VALLAVQEQSALEETEPPQQDGAVNAFWVSVTWCLGQSRDRRDRFNIFRAFIKNFRIGQSAFRYLKISEDQRSHATREPPKKISSCTDPHHGAYPTMHALSSHRKRAHHRTIPP
jgi:hypothetical protein